MAFPDEYIVAKEVRSYIETYFQVEIPESEDYYLTVLLVSLRANQASGRIGVVVAAHGNSTASSMVQVVQQLLDAENVRAVDMPLDMDPKTALDRIERNVQEVDEGSGVILLVDMGSLASFNSQIQRDTGIPVRTVDMVTTSLVLETVRKVSVLGTDLDMLHESLKISRLRRNIFCRICSEAKPIHKKSCFGYLRIWRRYSTKNQRIDRTSGKQASRNRIRSSSFVDCGSERRTASYPKRISDHSYYWDY